MTEKVIAASNRRQERKIHRRENIIAVARRSFFERGFAATSMSAIAAELGGSKATLWNYFPSKEYLFAAVIDVSLDEFEVEIEPMLDMKHDIEVALYNLCVKYIKRMILPEKIISFRYMLAEIARFPKLGEIIYQNSYLRALRLIAGYFKQHVEKGKLRDCDTLEAAMAFNGLCRAGIYQRALWTCNGEGMKFSEQEIKREAKNIVSAFLNGYASGKIV